MKVNEQCVVLCTRPTRTVCADCAHHPDLGDSAEWMRIMRWSLWTDSNSSATRERARKSVKKDGKKLLTNKQRHGHYSAIYLLNQANVKNPTYIYYFYTLVALVYIYDLWKTSSRPDRSAEPVGREQMTTVGMVGSKHLSPMVPFPW